MRAPSLEPYEFSHGGDWDAGQFITDTHELVLTDGAPPGVYIVKVGLYEAATGQRVSLLHNSGVDTAPDAVTLSKMRVHPRRHHVSERIDHE